MCMWHHRECHFLRNTQWKIRIKERRELCYCYGKDQGFAGDEALLQVWLRVTATCADTNTQAEQVI